MAYNAYSGLNYGGYYNSPQIPAPIPTPSTPAPQMQHANPMIWVQGETGAKSYLLAPNTTAPLWDSESPVIYLKSTDASGMPSMKVLDYTIREQTAPQPKNTVIEQTTDYVTHEELKDFENKIARKIDELTKEDLGA